MPGTRFAVAYFFVSTLLAQGQYKPNYCYGDCPVKPEAPATPNKPGVANCDPHSTATTAQAMLNAAQALGVDESATAACWLRLAAAQGDATAEGTLAIMLYTGLSGVPANLNEALSFAIKAANAKNYLGDTCLSLMYANGRGLEKDQAKSDFWQQAADRDKLASMKAKENPALTQASSQPHPKYGPDGDQPTDAAQAIPLPPVLHFCAQHCLTFTREQDGTLVNRTNLPGQSNEKRVFKIESFTPDSVIIHRTDYGSFPGEGTMTGRMQYGNSSAVGNGWAISWGKELDQLPKDDQERAIRAGIPSAPQQQAPPLALLFGVMAGIGASGGSSGGDLPGRISSLEDQEAAARDDCYRHTGRSGQPANDSSCDRQRSLESQLSEARGDLREEIQNLTDARNKLAPQCNAGNQEACEKQKQVDAQLARDRQFAFGNIFQ